MGYWKNKMIENGERGYNNIDKLVCEDCVDDNVLKDFVNTNGEIDVCDYCGEKGKCIGVESLIEQIIDGIEYEYNEPVNCMGVDHGEYVCCDGDILDTEDLISEYLGLSSKVCK
ncbi:HEPN-associated N-terminal domain-containing protein [Pectinatus frisingensis]|uniref:HEPN-associated N-terminal domain-containing protein n=1 Tax=Pectinatus frisingensis TaxID=865 RepID=UPI003D8058E1